MKKRVQRRNPMKGLDAIQEGSLIYGGINGFESKLQHRAAWFIHRDWLVDQSIENSPGTRPAAFWTYEQPGFEDFEGEGWEYLFIHSLLKSGELGAVIAQWSHKLELMEKRIELYPDEAKPWKRQAELLGGHALELFQRYQDKWLKKP